MTEELSQTHAVNTREPKFSFNIFTQELPSSDNINPSSELTCSSFTSRKIDGIKTAMFDSFFIEGTMNIYTKKRNRETDWLLLNENPVELDMESSENITSIIKDIFARPGIKEQVADSRGRLKHNQCFLIELIKDE